MKIISVILFIFSIINPKKGLYVFAFLLPLEEILNLTNSFTLLKFMGWGIAIGLLLWIGTKKVKLEIPNGFIIAIILAFWSICSAFWAIDARLSIERIPTIIQLVVLYLVIANIIRTNKEVSIIVNFYTFGCLISSIISLYYFYRFNVERASLGEFGSPNHVSLLILPAFLWTALNLNKDRISKKKILSYIAIVLFSCLIFLAASRGAIISLILTIILGILFLKNKKLLSVVVALIIGMLFILIYLNSTNRVRDILYRYKISKEYILFEDRASGRLDIWKVGLNAFLMNPILGYGLENYPIIFDEIYPNILTIRKLKYGRGSHNIFLQLGVELGLIGVFIFLVFLLYHIKNLVNIVKATSNDYLNNNISLFLFLSIIGLLIGGLSLDVLYRKYFWIFYSLSESIINQYKRKLKLNRLNK